MVGIEPAASAPQRTTTLSFVIWYLSPGSIHYLTRAMSRWDTRLRSNPLI
jgi:hypothetical protein